MNVLITSFQRSHDLTCPVFSAAVYQPKGYSYPKAEWADIKMEDGTWIRPREFMDKHDPLARYHAALFAHYTRRNVEIHDWLQGVCQWDTIALCCWCPYERRAQVQLAEFGSFVCHTAVIAEVLERDHGVRVWLDTDRAAMKVLP